MSSDRFDPNDLDNGDHRDQGGHRDQGDGRPGDGDLIAHLQAYGATLAANVDQPIRPTIAPTAEVIASIEFVDAGPASAEATELTVPLTMEARRANRGFWLAAAALVLVAAGFGLGRLWPDGDGAIDSTGSPDAESTVTESDVDDDVDGSDERGQPPADADRTDPSTTPIATTVPSSIVAADGTVVSVVDDLDALSPQVPEAVLDDPGDVVARAVLLDLIRQQVFGEESRAEVAERLVSGGLTITTTFDPAAADLADAAIAELHPAGDRSDEVALLTIDNRTGAIVATASSGQPTSVLIDGVRQPGSVFKSIVLAALFEQGYHPSDVVRADGPCEFVDPNSVGGSTYTVDGSSQQNQSLRAVTMSSNNCAFVRLGQVAGLDAVVTMGQELGLTTLPDGAANLLSLPLGVTEVNGVELAGAYATFANGGVHRDPWLVAEVVDADGEVLLARDPAAMVGTAILTEENASLLTAVLEENVIRGTGIRAQLTDHRAAGKTGTTNDFTNAWFVGYTPQFTTLVWVGDPNGLTPIDMPDMGPFGGNLPAMVWGRYNEALHLGLEPEPFPEGPDPLDGGGRLLEAEFEVELDG